MIKVDYNDFQKYSYKDDQGRWRMPNPNSILDYCLTVTRDNNGVLQVYRNEPEKHPLLQVKQCHNCIRQYECGSPSRIRNFDKNNCGAYKPRR